MVRYRLSIARFHTYKRRYDAIECSQQKQSLQKQQKYPEGINFILVSLQ